MTVYEISKPDEINYEELYNRLRSYFPSLEFSINPFSDYFKHIYGRGIEGKERKARFFKKTRIQINEFFEDPGKKDKIFIILSGRYDQEKYLEKIKEIIGLSLQKNPALE